MSPNRFKLPPLNALKAFHAAARHGSIRGAADELLVTPQAVSQQIKLLEDTLQIRLFERRGRSIEPTEAAVLLARYVEAGFEELAEGVRRVTTKKYRDRITLNVSPYFATRYLLPRLENFRESVPQSDLRMTTMVEMPDFKRDDIDIAVQWGFGEWGDLDAELLIKDHKVICCTPELAVQIRSLQDLTRQRLLNPLLQNTLWLDALRYLGVSQPDISSELAFHDAATMRRATLSGMGVGLISRLDAKRDIRAGDLVAPLGEDLLLDMPNEQVPGFYLVLPRAHRRVNGIENFCDWITRQTWREPEV
ncbi:LysR substrate-binding domain-containing protein [Roseovarius sp. 2305UL8-3]|uniref:LysR substrate-binding domain-containing protein n=1 Tax=Roseovarius conchicola TaxID=3121636 RepID=UPI003528752F